MPRATVKDLIGEEPKGKAVKKGPLCILGTAGTLGAAPYEFEEYEMWGCGPVQAHEEARRVDVLFEMHPRRYWGDQRVMARLNEFPGTIYMQDHYDEIPNSVPYPREEVKKKFMLEEAMVENRLPVTNTITWMILKAIYDGYKDISLYGVHMSHETEYYSQQPSCMWALGIIHGMMLDGKIKRLYIPKESELMKARFEYGYEEPSEYIAYVENRQAALNKGLEQGRAQINQLQQQVYRTEGAAMEADHLRKYLAGLK